MNLAWALCERNDPALLAEAEALCRRAVALAPEIATGHKILGNILHRAGRHDEARASFARAGDAGRPHSSPESAVATTPPAHQTRQLEGMALVEQGRLDEAEACFCEALRLEPELAARGTDWPASGPSVGTLRHAAGLAGKRSRLNLATPRPTGGSP